MKKLTVVGMGPGEYESMTLRAVKALNTCDVIVGYTVYVELAKPYFPEKEFLSPDRDQIRRSASGSNKMYHAHLPPDFLSIFNILHALSSHVHTPGLPTMIFLFA